MIQTQPMAAQEQEGPNIRLFYQRRPIYKVGFAIIFLSFVIYLYSFGSKSWLTSMSDPSFGIWQGCREQYFNCDKISGVFIAIKIISCVCLAGYCLTIVLGLWENFRISHANYHSRRVEWTALSTAFLGTVASLLFLFFTTTTVMFVSLGSAYFSNMVAMALLFVAGGLMACGHQPVSTRQGMVMTTMPQQQQTTIVYYSGHPPGPQAQPNVYNYNATANVAPPPQPCAPYNPANPYIAAPSPSYGAYPTPSPASPPPPYALPPTYPHQGSQPFNQQPPLPAFYNQQVPQQQQQLEASAPLLSEGEVKRKM